MPEDDILDQRYELAFRADYSSRYHRRRASFLTRLDRFLTLVVLLSGAGAFLSLVNEGPAEVGKAAAIAVTAISLFQVVFEVGLSGAKHSEWLRRWDRLATEIQCTPNPTEAQLSQWHQERSGIETECVGELRALAVDCENAARKFRGVEEGQRRIGRLQRLLIHVGTFQQEFPPAANPVGGNLLEHSGAATAN